MDSLFTIPKSIITCEECLLQKAYSHLLSQSCENIENKVTLGHISNSCITLHSVQHETVKYFHGIVKAQDMKVSTIYEEGWLEWAFVNVHVHICAHVYFHLCMHTHYSYANAFYMHMTICIYMHYAHAYVHMHVQSNAGLCHVQ